LIVLFLNLKMSSNNSFAKNCKLIANFNNYMLQNSILIIDNVASHKTAAVREMNENRGLPYKYLPAYSCFLNPIESLFSQWKHYVILGKCNSKEELMERIEDFKVSGTLTPDHCANYFRHVGQNATHYFAAEIKF